MAFQDLVGWLAAALVLATFSARSMVPLRAIAVSSNVAFVAYASMAGLWPVLLLHVVMLPLNVARLRQEIGAHIRANPAAPAGTPVHRVAANDNQESGEIAEVGALAMS